MVLSGGERAESWRMSCSMSFRMLVASAEVNDMLKTGLRHLFAVPAMVLLNVEATWSHSKLSGRRLHVSSGHLVPVFVIRRSTNR